MRKARVVLAYDRQRKGIWCVSYQHKLYPFGNSPISKQSATDSLPSFLTDSRYFSSDASLKRWKDLPAQC